MGLGSACQIAYDALEQESRHLQTLRDRLYDGISKELPDVMVHGHRTFRLPGNLNLSFPGLDSETIMDAIPDIAISSGSACTSTSIEPSYVIRALGLSEEIARGSLRFGIGRFTTEAEIDYSINRITDTVIALRTKGKTDKVTAL